MKKSIGIASAALVVALASAACAAQFSHEHPDGPKPWTAKWPGKYWLRLSKRLAMQVIRRKRRLTHYSNTVIFHVFML